MLLLLRLTVLLLVATEVRAKNTHATANWPVFWNVDDTKAPPIDVTHWGFQGRNYTQVGNGCSNQAGGCENWEQGMFPKILDNGTEVNGGVPQAGGLQKHLQAIKDTLHLWIPDPEWDGNAVLDFEDWTTVWELNNNSGRWHSIRYQQKSKEIVRAKHPTWSEEEVTDEAKREFEFWANEFFVRTLETCKRLRPRARWGFYGLPVSFMGYCSGSVEDLNCSYDGPLGDTYREYANRQSKVWDVSDALFPSIYIPTNSTDPKGLSFIAATVRESMRLASAAKGQTDVLPYAWHYYHDGIHILTSALMHASLQMPCKYGANGVVMWGSARQIEDPNYWRYFTSAEGAGTFTRTFDCHSC
eukprot:g966.t1